MKESIELTAVDHESLSLDKNNIRFFQYENLEAEAGLLKVEKESIINLVSSIIKSGFDPVFPLHVLANSLTVKDGNCRLLAYRLATGYKKYEELSKNYKISNFGKAKFLGKIPVQIYSNEDEINRYVRSRHLENMQKDWSTANRYKYFSDMYSEGENYAFPKNIKSIYLSFWLYTKAMELADEDLKERLKNSYQKKVTVLSRLFTNTKDSIGGKPRSLMSILGLRVDENRRVVYSEKITLEDFKSIILELAKFIVDDNQSVSSIKREIQSFPITNQILKSFFEKSIEKRKVDKRYISNEKTSSFSLYSNLMISSKLPYQSKNIKLKAIIRRIILENASWYLAAKILKISKNEKTWEFLKDNFSETSSSYKELFLSVQQYLFNEKNKNFKSSKEPKIYELFAKLTNEIKMLTLSTKEKRFSDWIRSNYSAELINLNKACHGKWNEFDEQMTAESIMPLLEGLIKEWNKSENHAKP